MPPDGLVQWFYEVALSGRVCLSGKRRVELAVRNMSKCLTPGHVHAVHLDTSHHRETAPTPVSWRALQVISGRVPVPGTVPGSWDRALELLESGRVELEPLVTEVVPLDEWERAFEASRTAAGVKFVLDPR